jgi:hypothetical protein
VKPDEHAEEVLADVAALSGGAGTTSPGKVGNAPSKAAAKPAPARKAAAQKPAKRAAAKAKPAKAAKKA